MKYFLVVGFRIWYLKIHLLIWYMSKWLEYVRQFMIYKIIYK